MSAPNTSFAWSKNPGGRDLLQNFCAFCSGILTVERTYPFELVSYPIIYMVICPQALTCFKVKGVLISADAIEASMIYIHRTYKIQKKSNIAATFFE